MAILVRCECGRYFERPDWDAGRLVACPACQVGVTVPKPPPEPDVLIIPDAAEAPKVSIKAVLSLVFGLLSFEIVPAFAAMILGPMALVAIVESRGRLKGRPLAIVGISLGFLGMLYAIFIPRNTCHADWEHLRQVQCGSNLRQIGMALARYHEANGQLPARAIVGRDGRPLLSWRVAILPDLGEGELYAKFHLDEPWDSPHNLGLLADRPGMFVCPSDVDRKPGMTNYQVVVGPKTAFPPDSTPLTLDDFKDGTFGTVLVGETLRLVPWTKPDDLPYDPTVPHTGLSSSHRRGFNLLYADGSPKFRKNANTPWPFLDAQLSPNGGDIAYGDDAY